MAKYRFAIDETGSFTMAESDKSFVCGVLISQDESTIQEKYRQAYIEMGLGEDAPNNKEDILKNFHFTEFKQHQENGKIKVCRTHLLPLVDKIYVSEGKPALYANNQNWWMVAVVTVIQNFLRNEKFEKNDEVEILIDNRRDTTFGILYEDDELPLEYLSEEERLGRFKKYHNGLKTQIEALVSKMEKSPELTIRTNFLSDTYSFPINLADLACGFVRTEKEAVSQPTIKCYCSRFMSGDNPLTLIDSNPLAALSLIFQELSNGNFNNQHLINADLLKKLKGGEDTYLYAWDMFYSFLKARIKERAADSELVKFKASVNVFQEHFKSNQEKIPTEKYLDLLILFVEYHSHIGEIDMPFETEEFLNHLKDTGKHSETRLLRKWEKYVSYTLRSSQIMFNGYNFSEAVSLLENVWNEQEKIISSVPDIIFNGDRKDEPTTALIGTLAQSYAYSGELKQAVEYFEMSRDYAIRTSSQTASFLFTIYHRQMDIEKAREQFVIQTGKTPEEYATINDFGNVWNLLSYCKLRALELYKNKQTDLPAVDLINLDNYNSEYPFPLIMKWEGIALWIENPDKNKTTVENYFTDAITNLSKKDNGFAIKTLVLPIIQCYALVNNQNPFHAQYNNYLADFKKQSDCFSDFIEQNSTLLNDLKNNANIWERALALPFIYA